MGSSRDPWDLLSWSDRVGSWGSQDHDEPGKCLGWMLGEIPPGWQPKAAPTPRAHRKTLLVTPHLPSSTLHEPLCPWGRSSPSSEAGQGIVCRTGSSSPQLPPSNATLGTHELRHLTGLTQAAPGIPFPGTGTLEGEAAAQGMNHPNDTPTFYKMW